MLTILPRLLAVDDVAGNELRELEDAGEVDLQDLLPAFERGVDGGIAVDGAGVVDEDIDAAEVCVHGGEERFGAGGGGEVGLEGGGGAADGLRGFVAARRLPWTATVAPASASAVAIAAPRPLAAPVTRATLLSRRKRVWDMRMSVKAGIRG